MTGGAVLVMAHQGGWDEAVFVAVPMVILAVLLSLARRRAEREDDVDAAPGPEPGPADH